MRLEVIMRVFAIASSAAFLLAGCASSKPAGPEPLEVKSTGVPGEAAAVQTTKFTATVLAVDTAARRLTLRGEDGTTDTIAIPPGVKRFDEISAGDNIVVEVQQGLLFAYQPVGSDSVAPTAVVAGARASPGEHPAGAVGAAVQATVTITGIDVDKRIVELQGPDGTKYHVKAGPKISIEKLVVGDRLLATYVATVAISLDKKL
jgi:hypothetical protein